MRKGETSLGHSHLSLPRVAFCGETWGYYTGGEGSGASSAVNDAGPISPTRREHTGCRRVLSEGVGDRRPDLEMKFGFGAYAHGSSIMPLVEVCISRDNCFTEAFCWSRGGGEGLIVYTHPHKKWQGACVNLI